MIKTPLAGYTEFSNKRFKCMQQDSASQSTSISSPVSTTNIASLKANLNTSISSIDESQNSTSPSSPCIQEATNSVLESITNKLNTKHQHDYASSVYNTVNCMQQNYSNYQNSVLGHQNYENYSNMNHHFQPNGFSNPIVSATNINQSQSNQFMNPLNQQHFYQNQLQMQAKITNNINNRNSTGSSANSSTNSLSSPLSNDDSSSQLSNTSSSLNQVSTTDLQHQRYSHSYNMAMITSHLNAKPDQVSKFSGTQTSNVNGLTQSQLQHDPSLLLRINPNVINNESDSALPIKKRRPVPVENKDPNYWEKRRKNNESAKRSRDIRRSKEEHISIRVIYLEQENLQLRTEVALLRNETEKLRSLLYANGSNFVNTN